MKALRIVFCVIACLLVAAVVPAAVWLGWYCVFFILGAVLFGVAMVVVKKVSEPKHEEPDFMNSEEKNAEILRKRDEGDK